jgi:hypothetical protein
MRFIKGHVDSTGRISGYSYGLVFASIKGFLVIFFIALVVGWPLLIHGPAGVALEVVWILSPLIVLQCMAWHHQAQRRRKAAGSAQTE